MSYDPKKVIAIAEGEIGYLEKKSNANLDSKTGNAGSANYTKYARDLDAVNFYNGRKNGFAWCDVFVDWCFFKAFGKDIALKATFQPTNNKNNCGAGCKYSRNYYKNKGRLFDTPQPGDQIFFYSSDKSSVSHTGLVYKVDNSYVYTIEGNTSGASGVVANGGGVCKKKYKRNYNRLAGFGRPEYGMDYTESAPEPVKEYALGERELSYTSPNMEGADVKALQTALNAFGFDCGTVDGIFGKNTKAGVQAFLKAAGLKMDGIFDAGALTALNLMRNQADTTVSEPEPDYETYVIQKGDSLWKIAKNFLGKGTRYPEIMGLNGLKNTVIHEGKTLKIPKKA